MEEADNLRDERREIDDMGRIIVNENPRPIQWVDPALIRKPKVWVAASLTSKIT